jgi:hypothetical protein
MLTGDIRALVDSSTEVNHKYGSVLLNGIGRSLRTLLLKLPNISRPWWELDDYLLTDIGKTPADAEVEKLRHRTVIRDPRELLAPGGPLFHRDMGR